MKSETKAILYIIGLCAAFMVYQEFTHNSQIKELEQLRQEIVDQKSKEMNKALEEQRKEAEAIQLEMATEIKALDSTAQALNQKLKDYEVRPNVDLNFVDAAEIILGAEYRPGAGNGNR